ncbi:hypothetical protein RHSIM_Rhsim10G0039500 [Rhododendron simsii]|uniref:Uncharacterized protein n=1 Tax=Rhododendron simsii TaxID=118357 RepID=A0A834LCK3_RHOSS|nr:hypothetical protein RHSIM_Rhsim10G0039500 [Rhododendron simsii]
MGRPPCCDKEGVKKGPWTPEEDIMLVSYIQEHGAGNWRAVPSKTGLRRCSKSCRLRWTNYLRPGIKRGSFTEDEEKMIIQLQALLGNKWAAIASYLPERTDNDIKNYWNTHLRKKLKKLQESPLCHSNIGFSSSHSISRGQWEKRLQTDINKAKQALNDALSLDKPKLIIPELKPSNGYISYSKTTQGSTYASSTENIARLLKGWVKKTPKLEQANSSSANETTSSEGDQSGPKDEGVDLSEAFESIFGFESFESSNSEFSQSMSPEASPFQDERKPDVGDQFPLSMLENWLFDEGLVQGKEELADFSFDINAELFV